MVTKGKTEDNTLAFTCAAINLIVAGSASIAWAGSQKTAMQAATIEGTYELIDLTLANGNVLKSPALHLKHPTTTPLPPTPAFR